MHNNCYGDHGTLGGEELESLISIFSLIGRRLCSRPATSAKLGNSGIAAGTFLSSSGWA